MELNRSVLDVFIDLVRKIFANTGNIAQRSTESKRFDVVCQSFDVYRGSAIRANPERIRALNFKKVSDLIKNEGDLEIAHRYPFYFTPLPPSPPPQSFRRAV